MLRFDIYTTNSCKWCVEAKSLLTRLGHFYTELSLNDDGNRVFFAQQGFKTVPQIYVIQSDGVKYIGGYYDLRKWLETKDNTPQ